MSNSENSGDNPGDNFGNSWGNSWGNSSDSQPSGNVLSSSHSGNSLPESASDRPQVPDEAPYQQLTPETILDAIDGAGWLTSGSLLALNSFENRVYQVGLDDGSFVVAKFYRPMRWSDAQILEEHRFCAELEEVELSVVPPLARDGQTLFEHAGYRFSVFARQGGHPPNLENEDDVKVLARTIARLHGVGSRYPFEHRDAPTRIDRARDNVAFLLDASWVPATLADAWHSTAEHVLEAASARLPETLSTVRSHGDCHLGNVLWRDNVPHFVDFDDCHNAPAIQDLWMLLPLEQDERAHRLALILEAYSDFRTFDTAELAAIEPLRAIRMLNHSAWIARRWHDPAFPPAFPYFAEERYWSDQILSLREQLSAILEASDALI